MYNKNTEPPWVKNASTKVHSELCDYDTVHTIRI